MAVARLIARLAIRVALAWGALLPWLAEAHAADVPISEKARELFQSGVALLEDRRGPRYAEAYEAFKAAYDDSPSQKILGNLGLCAAELERDGEAIDAYRRYLEATDIDPEERREIEIELRRLETNRAEVTLRKMPKGARVVDERRPVTARPVINRYGPFDTESVVLALRAGDHRIRVESPDGRSQIVVLRLAPGGTAQRDIDMTAPVVGDDDDDDDDGEDDGEDDDDDDDAATASGFPVAHVLRPMTLPKHVLSPALGFHLGHSAAIPDVTLGLDLVTASFGVFDPFEVDVALLPLEVTPDPDYGTSSVGLTLRYLAAPEPDTPPPEGIVELGTRLRLGHFRGPGERHFFIEPEFVKALFHLGNWGRLDTGFRLSFITRSPVTIGMRVPIRMAFQPIDVIYLGIATGVGIYDFDFAKETLFIPASAFLGATVPMDNGPHRGGSRPLVDVEVSFGFEPLFVPGGADKVDTVTYRGLLLTRIYFQL